MTHFDVLEAVDGAAMYLVKVVNWDASVITSTLCISVPSIPQKASA